MWNNVEWDIVGNGRVLNLHTELVLLLDTISIVAQQQRQIEAGLMPEDHMTVIDEITHISTGLINHPVGRKQ